MQRKGGHWSKTVGALFRSQKISHKIPMGIFSHAIFYRFKNKRVVKSVSSTSSFWNIDPIHVATAAELDAAELATVAQMQTYGRYNLNKRV